MVVRRRLALLAAIISPLILLSVNSPWLILAGVIAITSLAWLVDFFLTPNPSSVIIERKLPTSITLDRTGTAGWLISNMGTRTALVTLADEFSPSLQARTRRVSVEMAPGRTATIETDLEPTRRGRFQIAELVVRLDGPLGFAARQQTRWLPEEVRVFPRFPSRAEAELRLRRSRLDMGLRSARIRGGGSEFEQLRDFTVDDEFRKIDWSATARANRLNVKTYRTERNQTVINIMDNGRLMAGQVANVPRVEHAMDAIMAVTTVANGLGDRVGLLVFDDDVRTAVPASAGSTQLSKIINGMFDIEPELTESDYHSAFTQVLVRFSRRTMLIIHTELVEQTIGDFLLPALPLLTRSHVVVIAAVQDPEIERWAKTVPENAEDAHRHAAATASLAERRRAIAELRRAGATIVDAPPGKLAARLMDHYLDVKSTGRL